MMPGDARFAFLVRTGRSAASRRATPPDPHRREDLRCGVRSARGLVVVGTTSLDKVSVELPEAFDPRWNRIPGITVDGHRVTIDPEKYFFKLDDHSWLVIPWARVERDMLAATVLAIGYEVYRYIFRAEHLADLGMPEITAEHLTMLRQAGTFMALNKVQLTGEISNIGPAWFFNSTTRAVFDLTDEQGDLLDEVYHGGWFNEARRLELVRAHTALGGRLVHGCQSVPSQTGGAVVPYGAPLHRFREELARMKDAWIAAVEACRVTA